MVYPSFVIKPFHRMYAKGLQMKRSCKVITFVVTRLDHDRCALICIHTDHYRVRVLCLYLSDVGCSSLMVLTSMKFSRKHMLPQLVSTFAFTRCNIAQSRTPCFSLISPNSTICAK